MANHVILVRHGESVGNADETFYQYADSAVSLTPKGIRQAIDAGDLIRQFFNGDVHGHGGRGIVAYASEYTRAQKTARIVLDRMGRGDYQPQVTPYLNEINLGHVDVKYDFIKQMRTKDIHLKGTDGESLYELHKRLASWWWQVEDLLSVANIYVFAHAGTIRALLDAILGIGIEKAWDIKVRNAAPLVLKRGYTEDPCGGPHPHYHYDWVHPTEPPLAGDVVDR